MLLGVEISVMLVAILTVAAAAAAAVAAAVVVVVSNTNWNILTPSSPQRAKTAGVPSGLNCIL